MEMDTLYRQKLPSRELARFVSLVTALGVPISAPPADEEAAGAWASAYF